MKIRFRDDATKEGPTPDDAAAQAEAVEEDRATEEAEAELYGDEDADAEAGSEGGGRADEALSALQRERDDFESRLLRTQADYQNYIRRAQANAQRESEQSVIGVVKSLTMVLDHFDRALSLDPETTPTQTLLEGVTSIRDELLRTLGRYGVSVIEAEPGDAFDPERHEALMRTPHDTIEAGHIVQQLEPGYAVNDKAVRPAKVSIAG